MSELTDDKSYRIDCPFCDEFHDLIQTGEDSKAPVYFCKGDRRLLMEGDEVIEIDRFEYIHEANISYTELAMDAASLRAQLEEAERKLAVAEAGEAKFRDLLKTVRVTARTDLKDTELKKRIDEVLSQPTPGAAIVEALEKIERWELPETEDDHSYEWHFGSNGARDYIRSVARATLRGSDG